MSKLYILILILSTSYTIAQPATLNDLPTLKTAEKKTVVFFATDSVQITADTYFLPTKSPMILLCHQAGYSRGEYIDTAKKLNALGFSCMAIDQRSGKEVNGITNQTAIDADKKLKNVGYSGAKKDIDAAILYLVAITQEPVILVGSSYSASLALWIASENDMVSAVAAFSPGEYLKNTHLAEKIKSLAVPTFITSSKREIAPVEKLMRLTNSKYVTHYKPVEKGIHGSRAIWDSTVGYKGYWNAFKTFILAQKQ